MIAEVLERGFCPECGEAPYIDLVGSEVDWRPCCEWMQAEVEAYGFVGAYGCTVEEMLREACGFGDELREVFGAGVEGDDFYDDTTRARFPLEDVVPGAGVKGWQADVFADVDEHHSHHEAPQGWKFGVAVRNGATRVGVAVVGRPVSRMHAEKNPDDLEVTRVCCFGHPKLRRNAATKLYASCVREAKKLGCAKLITFTLDSEDATSLKAAGWVPVAISKGGSWGREDRAREDKAPTCRKVRWERVIDAKRSPGLPRIDLPAAKDRA